MAATMHHLLISKKYNDKYLHFKDDDLNKFLLGSISPDAPNYCGNRERREIAHFDDCLSFLGYCNITNFLNKYSNSLTDPFVLGYFVHLLSDNLWTDEIFEPILQNNIKIIDIKANKLEEISHDIIMDWYKKNIRNKEFSIYSSYIYKYNFDEKLPDFNTFNYNNQIDEVTTEEVKYLLQCLDKQFANFSFEDDKLKELKILDINYMLDIIDEWIIKIHNYISNS